MSSVSFKQFFWWRKSLLGGRGRKAPSAEVTNSSSRGRRRHENKQEDRGKTENKRELGFVLAASEELLWRERDRWKEEKGMKKRRWVEEEKGQGERKRRHGGDGEGKRKKTMDPEARKNARMKPRSALSERPRMPCRIST